VTEQGAGKHSQGVIESRWRGVPHHLSYKTVLATFTAHGSWEV